MKITRHVGAPAVGGVDEATRHGIRPAVRITAGIGIPINLHDEVVYPVVLKRRIEIEAEPSRRHDANVLGAPAVYFHRLIARVISSEIRGERGEVGVTATEFEIVERTRVTGVGVPFPFRYRAGGNGVRRQNQSLAPYGVDASTPAERIRGVRTLAAHNNGIRERRSGSQRA